MKVIITTPYKLYPPSYGRATRTLAIAEYLSKIGLCVTVLSPRQDLSDNELLQHKKGFNILFYKSKHRWSSFFNINLMRQIIRERKKNDTCIIVEHPCQGLLVYLLSRFLKIPVILDEYKLIFIELKFEKRNLLSNLMFRLERFLITKFNATLVVSYPELSILKSRGLKEPLLTPNGVNTDRFYEREKDKELLNSLGLTNFKLIIFFGNYNYSQNVKAVEIINSVIAPKVYEKREDVRFLLVGNNPPSINYHPAVITTGYVAAIEDYINLADIVIAPLLSSGGTRIKILEAMACARIVIASHLGAKGIIAEDGKDIILCAINDFPYKILDCLSGEIGADVPAAARKKALDYDWELILNPLRKLIEDSSV